MRKFFRDNSLTIVLMVVFLASLVGMSLTGWSRHLDELQTHGMPPVTFWAYVTSGEFVSALFENWESEFLQMAAYVCLTAVLFQRGSAESNDPDEAQKQRGSFGWLYSYSLGLALAALFVLSFLLHFEGSFRAAADEAMRHGNPPPGLTAYVFDPGFWFESFQNWQSEFLSTAVLVVLSIFLRFQGSPESKDVEDPHSKTGK